MTEYRLVAEPRADLDVLAAHQWYESEQAGLGLEFLEQVRIAYDRIAEDPFRYQELQSAVYFAVENDIVIVLAVLHASRAPAEWQRRRT